MEPTERTFWQKNDGFILGLVVVVLVAVLAYGGFRYLELQEKFETTTQTQRAEIADLKEANSELEEHVSELQTSNQRLASDLRERREEIDEFNERFAEVTQGIDTIRDTIETDPELLRKYSRAYFLSENYEPASLTEIDEEYTLDDNSLSIHTKVEPYLDDLVEDARQDGFDLLVASGYRSFEEQSELNNQYTVTYGAGTANQFSAEQGYSEHQLGTTVDFTTEETKDIDVFGSTEAFTWLKENAHKYGFVLSYPEDNRFYQYEPWHWRYVGTKLAGDLHEEGDYFYDWSQREIDAYRSGFFK